VSETPSPGAERRYERSDEAVRRVIAGEILLVPIRGELAQLQQMFVLDAVGDFIWGRLDSSRDLVALAGEIAGEFDVSREVALRDLVEFVDRLCDAGLARPVEAG
jgi:hypothetical protein